MKLHLGCGENYLPGYINIDFPPGNHTVQKSVKADIYTNILNLRYPHDSIEEIRLHHVFEHFKRVQAWALVGGWNSWLKKEGGLKLEVPDFSENAELIISKKTPLNRKKLLLRHLYGSQEANWAVHYHGWTAWEFRELLPLAGYYQVSLERIKYKGMANIMILAKKKQSLNRGAFADSIEKYASGFLVDDSASEKALKLVWMKEFIKILDKSWSQ